MFICIGAGWIHGIIGNPMSEMARRLNVDLHHIPSDTILYDAEARILKSIFLLKSILLLKSTPHSGT
jgi:hypothetical protein